MGDSMAERMDESEVYRQSWQQSTAWFATVDMLKMAADRLLDEYQVSQRRSMDQVSCSSDGHVRVPLEYNDLYCPGMLLMGYAIENLIKGIIICGTGITDPTFGDAVNFEEFRAVNRRTKQRDLVITEHLFQNLLKADAIRSDLFTEDEKKVLHYLDRIVMWGGRYPVPKKREAKKHESIYLVCVEPLDSPIAAVRGIYDKARREMSEVCKRYRES